MLLRKAEKTMKVQQRKMISLVVRVVGVLRMELWKGSHWYSEDKTVSYWDMVRLKLRLQDW